MGARGSEGREGATERAAEALVPVLPDRFSAQKGPHRKGTVLGDVAGPGTWVTNLVIFGTFLKTWI